MTRLLPLCSWRLSAEGLAPGESGPSFLPGADRLSRFSALLGLEDAARARDFPVPGLLPEGARNAVLSADIPFARCAGDYLILCFPLLRGSGRVLLGESEIARFGDGELTLELPRELCAGTVRLSLCFDEARPAGVPALPTLRSADGACLRRVLLFPEADGVSVRAEAESEREALFELAACADACSRSALRVRLAAGNSPALLLRCPGLPASGTLVVTLSRVTDSGALLLCDRLALRCGAAAEPARVWLPLSREEALREPDAMAARLKALRIPAVRVPGVPPEALCRALDAADVGLIAPDVPQADRLRLGRFPRLSFAEAPEPRASGACAAWQLCGLARCPRGEAGLADEAMLREAFGPTPPDPARLSELPRLLLRLRADGAAMGLYSGPLAPPGALSDPELLAVLSHAAGPHAAALPLFGAWWCGQRFSCRLAAPRAPEGCAVRAALCRGDEVLSELSFPSGETPELRAVLPDEPCVLRLRLSLSFPDGALVTEEPLPVFAGLRGPLEAIAGRPCPSAPHSPEINDRRQQP